VTEVRPTVFISYARSDDEPFVERLHRDLEKARIDVWWDRDTMPSRGRTFLQEIRDAIESVDRVIAVIGPAAVRSDYVRYEWDYALLFAKGLLPILRLGDHTLLPSELRPDAGDGLAAVDFGKLHSPDFRDGRPYDAALAELTRIIRQPVAALASYDGTPALPPHWLARPDDLQRLHQSVLADILCPEVTTAKRQTIALTGMGGMGKSVLAAAFARAITTRRSMVDGIVWLTAGPEATKDTVLANLKAVGTTFGDAVAAYVDEPAARRHLAPLLAEKACLIVLDDVWALEQVKSFRDVMGPRCRLLFTTRDGAFVTALDATEHRVDALSDDQAIALLADWSGEERQALSDDARAVASRSGNVPLALALCGAMARDGTPWADLLTELRDANLAFIEGGLPDYQYPNVLRALGVSVEMLGRVNRVAADLYLDLAVFPRAALVPEAAVLTLWCRGRRISEPEGRKLLGVLARKALLTAQGKSPNRQVSFHTLHQDYLKSATRDRIEGLHDNLLEGYREKCAGWATGPNDGYFFQRLPWHLAQAGHHEELRDLLLQYEWIKAKLAATDAPAALADFALTTDSDTAVVGGALLRATHAIGRDPQQLPGQIVGRLRDVDRPRITSMVTAARDERGFKWLEPLRRSLLPSGPLLRTFIGHTDAITSIALFADGRRALSGSRDTTLRLWNVETGGELRRFDGHSDVVNAVALLPDGRRVLTGSGKTLRLWDVETGECLRTDTLISGVRTLKMLPDGRRALVACPTLFNEPDMWLWHMDVPDVRPLTTVRSTFAMAPLPDGRRVLFASVGMTLWDLESGETLQHFKGHRLFVNSLALLPDGRRALSASDDRTLRIWDLGTGAELHLLEGHRHNVEAVALLSDGRRAVSGSADSTLRLWDLETGQILSVLENFSSVTALAILPATNRALSGSADGELRLWDLDVAAIPRSEEGHTDHITELAVLPDGQRVLSASKDGALALWNPESGAMFHALDGQDGAVNAIAVLPDGNRVVTASQGGALTLWDLARGEKRRTFRQSAEPIMAVALMPDGHHVLSAHLDRSLLMWDLEADETLSPKHIGYASLYVKQLIVLPDGQRVLVSAGDYNMDSILAYECDLTLRSLSEYQVKTLDSYRSGSREEPAVVAMYLDGRHAVSGSWDGTLRLWSLDEGTELGRLNAGESVATALAIYGDGRRALAGFANGLVQAWDLETGAERRRFDGHTHRIGCIAVLPDGRRAISGSDDRTMRLWDLEAGICLSTFTGDAPMTAAVAIRNDLFVAGSANGRVHVLASREPTSTR
jgi:WD40 repeat protein